MVLVADGVLVVVVAVLVPGYPLAAANLAWA